MRQDLLSRRRGSPGGPPDRKAHHRNGTAGAFRQSSGPRESPPRSQGVGLLSRPSSCDYLDASRYLLGGRGSASGDGHGSHDPSAYVGSAGQPRARTSASLPSGSSPSSTSGRGRTAGKSSTAAHRYRRRRLGDSRRWSTLVEHQGLDTIAKRSDTHGECSLVGHLSGDSEGALTSAPGLRT